MLRHETQHLQRATAELMLALQIRAYEQLGGLQGECVPVLEAAGLLGGHSVIVAVSGGRRVDPDDPPADPLHRLRWDALESLRRIHDCGVLHGDVGPCSLFIRQSSQVGVILSCFGCRMHAVNCRYLISC